jgi:hypothetical protein
MCNKYIEVHLLDIIILNLMKMHGQDSIKHPVLYFASQNYQYPNMQIFTVTFLTVLGRCPFQISDGTPNSLSGIFLVFSGSPYKHRYSTLT